MNKIAAYIESGILELYVLGAATEAESQEVARMAAAHEEIRAELDAIRHAMESYSSSCAMEPHEAVKPLLFATIDFMERLQQGEAPADPPLLHEHSRAEDFAEWIRRPDMLRPDDAENIFVKLIGHTPQATTGIVWLQSHAPYEVHDDTYERFLILEGTCDIIVGEDVHHLVPGNYLQIPLHLGHHVRVTSSVPCKVILQRVAA